MIVSGDVRFVVVESNVLCVSIFDFVNEFGFLKVLNFYIVFSRRGEIVVIFRER